MSRTFSPNAEAWKRQGLVITDEELVVHERLLFAISNNEIQPLPFRENAISPLQEDTTISPRHSSEEEEGRTSPKRLSQLSQVVSIRSTKARLSRLFLKFRHGPEC